MIRSRVAALTALYLLVVCAVGMLHPVRNALVLGTLGGQGFYKVYVASALVALAVVPFGRLAAHVPQQRLTPAVALPTRPLAQGPMSGLGEARHSAA